MLTADRISRRDFGKLAGLAGSALAAPLTAAAGGAATASPTAGPMVTAAPTVTRSWRVSGRSLGGLGDFDATMKSFMQERDIACGSLAVTRHGRLLLARGYTWSADPALNTRPTSLFRTASVTKPVTAAAVLRLVQDGRLRLTDRVAGLLGLGAPADPRLRDVTVLSLLQHLGGWDRAISFDPLFSDQMIASALGKSLPIGREDIVAYVTARPLDHPPGTTYAYSNYGYLLLGKIIEKITGTAYADHVRTAVLAPLGITRMRLGRTLVPATGEMPYYSRFTGTTVMDASGGRVAAPYGTFNLENNASNGGWLAAAVDLTRIATIYDGATTVLTEESVARAFAPPATGVDRRGRYYGCGWHVRPDAQGRTTWHSGSLPGTYALLARRFDGLTWAVMFGQRDDPSGESYADIDADLGDAADAVGTWPSGDLSGDHFPAIRLPDRRGVPSPAGRPAGR